jgi:hypothetical protein
VSNRNQQKGTRFERLVADYLNEKVDDRIDRRVKTGSNDKGDIGGWRFNGLRIVAELKDHSRLDLSGWVNQAEIEAGNDDAEVALVIHKRRGKGHPGAQYVTLTLDNLLALLTGGRS